MELLDGELFGIADKVEIIYYLFASLIRKLIERQRHAVFVMKRFVSCKKSVEIRIAFYRSGIMRRYGFGNVSGPI